MAYFFEEVGVKRTCLFALLSFAVFSSRADNPSNITTDNVPVDASTHMARVILSATPSTGYNWYLKSYPGNFIDQVGYEYKAPSESMPGRAGTATFTFTVEDEVMQAPHLIPVVFTNARPWQLSDGQDKTVWLVVSAPEVEMTNQDPEETEY